MRALVRRPPFDVEAAVRELARRLEEAQSFLGPVRWSGFVTRAPAERIDVLKACVEHILASDQRAAFVRGGGKGRDGHSRLRRAPMRRRACENDVALLIALRANLTQRARGNDGNGQAGPSNGSSSSCLARWSPTAS